MPAHMQAPSQHPNEPEGLVRATLPATTSAPGIGRSLVDRLEPAADPELVDEVRLLVSELVTNSVRHAALADDDGIDVVLELLPDVVRVRVEDHGRGFEAKVHHRPDQQSGWGLYLVDKLAKRWGTEQVPDNGSAVWFEMDRAAR